MYHFLNLTSKNTHRLLYYNKKWMKSDIQLGI